MSNSLAIATVTATLRSIVAKALPTSGFTSGAPEATHVRPDADAGLPFPGVNLFLYRVSPNPAWRNADLPTRRGATLLRHPQIGLDLHYLLSFYGDDKELEPQRLLGIVTSALHADPTLLHSTIETVKATVGFLHNSDLDQQAELVRVTPAELTLEELTKLWSAFFQTKYVLSMAYNATVVLLEAIRPTAPPALPVAKAEVIVQASRDPFIEAIVPETITQTKVGTLPTLQLRGENLRLTLDNPTLPPGSPPVESQYQFAAGLGVVLAGSTNKEVTLQLPNGVAIGENWVRITNDAGLGAEHLLATSNTAAFTLRPFVRAATIIPPVVPSIVKRLRVDLLPTVGIQQSVRLVLVPAFVGGVRREIPAPVLAVPATQFDFDVTAVPAGNYLVLIDVDGQFSERFGPVTL